MQESTLFNFFFPFYFIQPLHYGRSFIYFAVDLVDIAPQKFAVPKMLDFWKASLQLFKFFLNLQGSERKSDKTNSDILQFLETSVGTSAENSMWNRSDANNESCCDKDRCIAVKSSDTFHNGRLDSPRDVIQEFYRNNSDRIDSNILYGTPSNYIPDCFRKDPLENYNTWSPCIN